MTHKEFHDAWQNLIFTPLDISNPPCESQKLAEFMSMFPGHSHEDQVYKFLTGEAPVRSHYDKVEFNFFRSFHVINTIFPKPWRCDLFAEMFPEVSDWIETLPLAPEKRFNFGWINQLSAPDVPDIDISQTCNIHVDEPGSFGLRWFKNNLDNNLYFYGTRPDVTIPSLVESCTGNKTSWNLYHDQKNTYHADHGIPRANHNFYNEPRKISTASDTGFMLGQHRAAHVIRNESHCNKCTFILETVGKLEDRWLWSELNELVEKSIDNYPGETIWHEDFCD